MTPTPCTTCEPQDVNAAIERLIRAALDQRQPSKRLKRTLNDVLDLIDHPLSLRHDRQWRRRQER